MLLLLAECTPPAPQYPTQRKGQTPKADTAALALLELNRKLTLAADEQLMTIARAQEEQYALYDCNVWMHIFDTGDELTETLREGETVTVHMRVCALDGKMLQDIQGTYRVGKFEMPEAVDRNITALRHGAKARLYAPWYAAFGLKGTQTIPPYENVIIDLEVK